MAVALCVASASATQVTVYEVLQPVWSDRGLVATGFSYARYEDTLNDPTLLVRLTAAESRLGGPDGFANWNEANRIGIQIQVAPPSPSAQQLFPGLSGDTLEVVLDLSNLTQPLVSASCEELVDLTVECMIENASRSRRHQIHFLKIAALGDSSFAHHSGVHVLHE